jgi:hypothetical protein
MTALATLAGRLTLPYRRGAEHLPLSLGPDAAGVTPVLPYDFREYRARWGENPSAPLYVVRPLVATGADDVTLTLQFTDGAPGSTSVTIPAGTRAGAGFAVAAPTSSSLRLVSLAASPGVPEPGAKAWAVTALLGVTAKLLWVLGAEKDEIAQVRRDVRDMRFVESAFASGLDALGRDLHVPRFPPRPYSPDPDTVALWHLDEVPNGGPVTTVADQATPSHPGTVAGAAPAAPGKYATAFAFPAAGAAITVASSADFDIAAAASCTIEAFVRADAPADATPRAIVARRAAETAAASNTPGWSLCVASARGFDANVLFAVCDGAHEARLFADLTIADGRFHHVAGIVDRASQRARLFVDGVQRATAPIDTLVAVAPAVGVRLGSTAGGNNFSGSIDEVRISRSARTTFHPALGEDDEAYRGRLRIFRRWAAPTPAQVIAMVNEAAPLPNDAAPYVLVEANRPTQVAEKLVRIVPAKLAVGNAIGLDGAPAQSEAVAGGPDDDAGFDPTLDLIKYANPLVDASGDPGGAKMQAVMGAALDALVGRLPSPPGKVIINHSFDTAGPTPLHGVGRALRIRHSALATDVLAALCHRAGFAYVRNFGAEVAVAVAAGDRAAIRSAPAATPHVTAGAAFDLTVDPPLPTSGAFSWTVITPGPAGARLDAHSADAPGLKTPIASRPRVRLVTLTPGDLAVRVEHSHQGRTRSGVLRLRIDAATIADGHASDRIGNADPAPAPIAGTPDAGFLPAYLVTHSPNVAIDFGADPHNVQMQAAARDALDALAAQLAAQATPGKLKVTQAFVPGAPGVESVGRRLVLGHETLDPGALAALAARFFDYVSRAGAQITAVVRPDAWIELGDAASGAALASELVQGVTLNLGPTPSALPAGVYNWSTRIVGNGDGAFDTVAHPSAHFTPSSPGLLLLSLTYVQGDPSLAAPYSFEIRLKPALDVPATNIPKAQYDIIMNVLDAFHPIGVEVRTDNIRQHVKEIEQDPTKAFPGYSFPNFRL